MKYQIKLSNRANKKYAAHLSNGKIVDFGDKRYRHYSDGTNLRAFSILDHHDKKRRDMFYARHLKNIKKPYSAAWFAARYLWT